MDDIMEMAERECYANLGITYKEFRRRWFAGDYEGDPRPEVTSLAYLITGEDDDELQSDDFRVRRQHRAPPHGECLRQAPLAARADQRRVRWLLPANRVRSERTRRVYAGAGGQGEYLMLVAYLGVMNSGKSTLALQYHHSLGGQGYLFTALGRDGRGVISSRVGLQAAATEVDASMDLATMSHLFGAPYLVVDEAQFLTTAHVVALAGLADMGTAVYTFGLKTDFRGELFEGSKRLLELADEVRELPVRVNCWCDKQARFNARVADGQVVREGETVEVGDIGRYQVLCREHFLRGVLAPSASMG